MTVARESEIEAETGEILVSAEETERPCETQTQLIPVKRQALYLLEHLREIDRRHTGLSRDLAQRPAPPEFGRQDELRAVDEFLPTETPARGVRGALAERATHERQHKDFRFQRFGALGLQAVADKRDHGLGARVDPQPLAAKRHSGPAAELKGWHELAQPRLSDRERQAISLTPLVSMSAFLTRIHPYEC